MRFELSVPLSLRWVRGHPQMVDGSGFQADRAGVFLTHEDDERECVIVLDDERDTLPVWAEALRLKPTRGAIADFARRRGFLGGDIPRSAFQAADGRVLNGEAAEDWVAALAGIRNAWELARAVDDPSTANPPIIKAFVQLPGDLDDDLASRMWGRWANRLSPDARETIAAARRSGEMRANALPLLTHARCLPLDGRDPQRIIRADRLDAGLDPDSQRRTLATAHVQDFINRQLAETTALAVTRASDGWTATTAVTSWLGVAYAELQRHLAEPERVRTCAECHLPYVARPPRLGRGAPRATPSTRLYCSGACNQRVKRRAQRARSGGTR